MEKSIFPAARQPPPVQAGICREHSRTLRHRLIQCESLPICIRYQQHVLQYRRRMTLYYVSAFKMKSEALRTS